MIIFLVIIIAFIAIIYLFMQQTKFGKKPAGNRLQLVQHSLHYKEGKFQNQSFTPALTEGASFPSVLKEFIFVKKERKRPAQTLPSVKTDLLNLKKGDNVLIWMGHSSYFMQLDGKTFLIDPVLSGAASPLSFTTKSFAGADIYTTDDIPPIDFLFISHDHWDHLDYTTIKKLQPKIGNIITGLGTGQHFERWGFDMKNVIEKDWNESVVLTEGFKVTVLPARHFSGRSFTRNTALWVSFALQTPTKKIYLGGDSGYDTHFKTIGDQYGPFDLAILECGQYDKNWKYIHMMPEETAQAALDLKAKKLLPVHWAKFALSNHAWDDSIKRVYKAANELHLPLLTPMIGERLALDNNTPSFSKWWEQVN